MHRWIIFICTFLICAVPLHSLQAQQYHICRVCHLYPCQCGTGCSSPPTQPCNYPCDSSTPETTCAPYPYNQSPCGPCGPYPGYYPSAPVCGTACALSYTSIFLAVAVVVGVAAIVLSVGDSLYNHNPLVVN